MGDRGYMLKANNMVHSRVNEITRKYEYVIEGSPTCTKLTMMLLMML